MSDVFFHNVALIFDAINTYSTTMTECFQSPTPLPALREDVIGDCVEFCQYLTERVSALQQEHHEFQEQHALLQQQHRDDILRAEQREQELETQVATLVEAQKARTNQRFSGLPSNSRQSGKSNGQFEDHESVIFELESKSTMLETKIDILESEIDALSTTTLTQQSTIAAQSEHILELGESNAKMSISVKKIANEKVQLEEQLNRHKDRYVQLRTDYYSLEQTNSQLRQEIASHLIEKNSFYVDVVNPLKKESQQWQQKYESLQLQQLASDAFIYIDPSTIGIPDGNQTATQSSTNSSIRDHTSPPSFSFSSQSHQPSTISTARSNRPVLEPQKRNTEAHFRLLKSLQLEIKLLRFENKLLQRNAEKTAHIQQQWEHSITSYHDLYELYQQKVQKMAEVYQDLHQHLTLRNQNTTALIAPLRQSIYNDKKYQSRYYSVIQNNVQLRFDVQTLLFTLSQLQFSPSSTPLQSPSSNPSSIQQHKGASLYLPMSNTPYQSQHPFTSHEPPAVTLQAHIKTSSDFKQQHLNITNALNSISTMMKVDRLRVYSPLLFAHKLFHALNTLVTKYKQLYTRFYHLQSVQQRFSEQHDQIEQYRSQLAQVAEQHQLALSQLEQKQAELNSCRGQYSDEKGNVDELNHKFTDLNRRLHASQIQNDHQRDQIDELNHNLSDYHSRYNNVLEEKKHVQTILGHVYRENDDLRHLLTANGIIHNPSDYPNLDPHLLPNGSNSSGFEFSPNGSTFSNNSVELGSKLQEQVALVEKMKEYMNDYRQKAKDKLDSVLDAHRSYKNQAEQAFHTLQRRYSILCNRVEQLYQQCLEFGETNTAVFRQLEELRSAILN